MSDSHSHSHHHHHSHVGHRHGHESGSTLRLRFALILNLVFTVVEVVGGFWTGSMAVLADAVHDLGDSLALALALYLEQRAAGAPSKRFSYGPRRLSLLSAAITGVVLVSGSILIGVGALHRLLNETHEPNVRGMLALATLGLSVNGFAAWRLARGRTLNERVMSWHLIEDVLGWAAVLVGALVMQFWEVPWLDPLLALVIASVVGFNGGRNLLHTTLVFLQHTPPDLDETLLRSRLSEVVGVQDIHDLHVWSLDGQRHVVSLHAVVGPGQDSLQVKQHIRHIMEQFGAVHTTIETETVEEICAQDCESQHESRIKP